MKITERVHLEKSGQYFRLVEKGLSKPKNGGEPKEIDINVREFGTVYQALQVIIESDYDLDKPLKEQLTELVKAIDMNKDKIRDNFRIDVKTTK